MDFIGVTLDLTSTRVCLPTEIFKTVNNLIRQVSFRPHALSRLFLQGYTASCTCITVFARLHLHCLQAWLWSIYPANRDHINARITIVTLPRGWTRNKYMWEFFSCHRGIPYWAAHLDNHTTQVIWTLCEARIHVNLWELRAGHLACIVFLPLGSCHVQIMSDSMTALFYINKLEQNPFSEALNLWNWFIRNHITVLAECLPGAQDSLEDNLSRHFSTENEWEIYNFFLNDTRSGEHLLGICSHPKWICSKPFTAPGQLLAMSSEATPFCYPGQVSSHMSFLPSICYHKFCGRFAMTELRSFS